MNYDKESYVYTLAYPDGMVFYVGQGIRNRIKHHEMEARRGTESVKCEIIRQIWREGGEVVRTKVQVGISCFDALVLERKLIAQLQPAGNKIGHNKPKVSIVLASVREDLAKRFRYTVTKQAGRKLSEQEIADLATQLAYRAIDDYCEASERDEETMVQDAS